VQDAHALVAAARRVVVLTGAGISTDSGIPDFRGPNGVWTKNPKAERTSNIEYYVADPEVRRLAWQGRLRWVAESREPNPGHRAVVELDRRGALDTLVTQNIDGLHQAAGSRRVIEVHGSIRTFVCLDCGHREPLARVLELLPLPACERCGRVLKPGVVMFGELLPPGAMEQASELVGGAGLLLVVGSALEVYPVAGLPDEALASGARLAIVNKGSTPYDSRADLVVDASAGETLGAALALLGDEQGSTSRP